MSLLDSKHETEEFVKLLDSGFYSKGGCNYSDYDDFACTLFNVGNEMVGINPEIKEELMREEYTFKNFVELGLDDNCSECKYSRRKSDKEPCVNCSPQHCAWESKKVKE